MLESIAFGIMGNIAYGMLKEIFGALLPGLQQETDLETLKAKLEELLKGQAQLALALEAYVAQNREAIHQVKTQIIHGGQHVHHHYGNDSQPKPQFPKDILPVQLSGVIGREADLAELEATLARGQTRTLLFKGVGGIGKTWLANAYVYQHRAEYQHIYWIGFTGDLKASFTGHPSLVPFCKGQVEEDFLQLHSLLEGLPGPKLLVIDDLKDPDQAELFRDHFTSFVLLATSRSAMPDFFHRQDIGFLSHENAKELFEKHYQRQDLAPSLVESLLEAAGYHTKLIELVAKNLAVGVAPPEKVLEALQRGVLHDSALQMAGREQDRVEKALENLFDLSQVQKRPLHLWLLQQLALLPVDFYPWQEFAGWLQLEREELVQCTQAIQQLAQEGWLDHDPSRNAYRCHEVITWLVRLKAPLSVEICYKLLISIHALIRYRIQDNWVPKLAWLPLAERALELLEEKHLLLASLWDEVGFLQSNQEQHIKAIASLQKAWEIKSKLAPEDFSLLGIAQHNLGWCHWMAEDWPAALACFKKAVELKRKRKPPEPLSLAASIQFVGRVLKEMKLWEEAEEQLKEALDLSETHAQEEDAPSLAIMYHDMGSFYGEQQDFAQALPWLQKEMEMTKTYAQALDPELATSHNNLAHCHYDLGQGPEALREINLALSIKEQVIPKHSSTKSSQGLKQAILAKFPLLVDPRPDLGKLGG